MHRELRMHMRTRGVRSLTTALADHDPRATHLESITESIHQLDAHFGVTTHWSDTLLDLCDWDGPTRTATLASDGELEDLAWVLIEVWRLCVFGRHAVPDAVTRRHLHVVPQ